MDSRFRGHSSVADVVGLESRQAEFRGRRAIVRANRLEQFELAGKLTAFDGDRRAPEDGRVVRAAIARLCRRG
jgi:hypothetical protein